MIGAFVKMSQIKIFSFSAWQLWISLVTWTYCNNRQLLW